MTNEMHNEVKNASVGLLATAGSLTVSLANVNAVLTCASLVVGLAVGVASLVKILRSKKHRNHHNHHRN